MKYILGEVKTGGSKPMRTKTTSSQASPDEGVSFDKDEKGMAALAAYVSSLKKAGVDFKLYDFASFVKIVLF